MTENKSHQTWFLLQIIHTSKFIITGKTGYECTPKRTPDFWTSPKNSINLTGFQIILWGVNNCSIQLNFRYTLVLWGLTRNSGYLTGLKKSPALGVTNWFKRNRIKHSWPRIHQLPCLITGTVETYGHHRTKLSTLNRWFFRQPKSTRFSFSVPGLWGVHRNLKQK